MKASFMIGKDFKVYAKMRGWTVKELAKQLRYKEPQVSAIMSGAIEPSMRFLHRLCEFSRWDVQAVLETKFQ